MVSILICDDHPMVRRGTRDCLREYFPTATIGEAGTGAELIAMARKQKWDAFIMDLNLPDRSGTELLEELLDVDSDARVLIFSIHLESTHAVRMIRSGARGYLNKTTTSDQLIAAMQAILEGGRYVSAQVIECLLKTIQTDPLTTPLELLSNREFQILRLLASGKSLKEIAGDLSISPSAVSTYRGRILKKLGVKSNAELARYALGRSLVEWLSGMLEIYCPKCITFTPLVFDEPYQWHGTKAVARNVICPQCQSAISILRDDGIGAHALQKIAEWPIMRYR